MCQDQIKNGQPCDPNGAFDQCEGDFASCEVNATGAVCNDNNGAEDLDICNGK